VRRLALVVHESGARAEAVPALFFCG
jgi:hypothetical protein